MDIKGNFRSHTIIQNVAYWPDTGVNGDYFATVVPAPITYITGYLLYIKANSANSASSTVNVNGLGSKTLYKNYNQALGTNDIVSGQVFNIVYDGINFQLIGGGSSSSAATVIMGTGEPVASSGSLGNFFWDSGGKFLYIKDNDGWQIH